MNGSSSSLLRFPEELSRLCTGEGTVGGLCVSVETCSVSRPQGWWTVKGLHRERTLLATRGSEYLCLKGLRVVWVSVPDKI